MKAGQRRTVEGASRELLSFTLGKEACGVDILKVPEIRGYEAVTTIANVPEFIKGAINLRGIIVPIVDIRIKFKSHQIQIVATSNWAKSATAKPP